MLMNFNGLGSHGPLTINQTFHFLLDNDSTTMDYDYLEFSILVVSIMALRKLTISTADKLQERPAPPYE